MHECGRFLLQRVLTSILHLTMALAFARIALKAAATRMDFCLALLVDFDMLLCCLGFNAFRLPGRPVIARYGK